MIRDILYAVEFLAAWLAVSLVAGLLLGAYLRRLDAPPRDDDPCGPPSPEGSAQ